MQQLIVFYFKPACNHCGWQAERIFRRGEEEAANKAFDDHPCDHVSVPILKERMLEWG